MVAWNDKLLIKPGPYGTTQALYVPEERAEQAIADPLSYADLTGQDSYWTNVTLLKNEDSSAIDLATQCISYEDVPSDYNDWAYNAELKFIRA